MPFSEDIKLHWALNIECSRDCFDYLLDESDDDPINGDDVDGTDADAGQGRHPPPANIPDRPTFDLLKLRSVDI